VSEERFVGKLKEKAIEDDWNKIQGKGDKSDNNQDLLSHSLDVVQITHNLLETLEPESGYSEKDFLAAAFLHDLHKLEGLGGTESLETDEVEEVLESWDIKGEILQNFSLQEFTDVLKSIHQYTGSSEARTRVNSDTELQRLAYVIRLADGVASTIEFSNLYQAGKWRSNKEAVERLNQGFDEDYMLGYHQLSEVKPALGNLIHGSVRKAVRKRDGCPIASRKDGTIYLLPEDFDEEGILEDVKRYSVEEFKRKKSSVPQKIRESVFGPILSIETAVESTRNDLGEERGDDDLFDDYRRVAESNNSWEKDSTKDNWTLELGGEGLLEIDEDNKKYLTDVPSTQKGALIGDLLGTLASELNKKEDPEIGDELSRLDVLNKLTDTSIDIHKFDVRWNIEESHLAKIVGNHYFQETDQDADEIIEQFENRSKRILEENEETGAVEEINGYIQQVLHLESSRGQILTESFSPKVDTGTSYEELCITCGRPGEYKFRTTGQGGAYSKTFMARGLIGEASETWKPKLCLSCFLDQTLMRALVRSENVSISSMEDTIFLKVFPGRYLGTRQAKVLKNKLAEHKSAKGDAGEYLENEKNYAQSTLSQLASENEEIEEVELDEEISVGSMSALASSENYFLLAIEDYSDSPSKQITQTWLKAVQRGLLFRELYNLDIEISNSPEIAIDRPYPEDSGVHLESPPSQISSVFGNHIRFDKVKDNLDGIANLVYSTNYARAEGSNDLNIVYSEFKDSLFPGSRIYRAAQRKYDRPEEIDETFYQNIFRACKAIDSWKGSISGVSNMNRLQNVVDSFKISAKPNASTYMIQDPVRTLANKILKSEGESREEILNQAAGEIYRRVERKWDNPDIYFGYDTEEDIKDLIYEGCVAFYDDVYQGMLDGDKIKLANQKNDILDGFYFIVRRRGVSE